MTNKQIEQKAEAYAELLTAGNKEHNRAIYTAAKEGFEAGAYSRDEEIKELKEEIESLKENEKELFDGFKNAVQSLEN